MFGDNPDDTIDLLSMLGPPPHVIKLNEGTQGAGVMLTEKPSASRSVIEALRGLYANFLVQEFIAEAKGADLRCFVVGGEVVATMRRQAPKGDFRSNLHRGGSAKPVRASEDEQQAAIRAAEVLGLGVAGVDLIRSGAARWCWRSIPPLDWKASRPRPASTSPAGSSTSWSRATSNRTPPPAVARREDAFSRILNAIGVLPSFLTGV